MLLLINLTLLEFNLHTDKRVKDRHSVPPAQLDKSLSNLKSTSFHAHPMPDFSKLHAQTQPRKSMEPVVTKAKEFNFNVDKRGEEHKREFQLKLQKEEEEIRNMRKFKA